MTKSRCGEGIGGRERRRHDHLIVRQELHGSGSGRLARRGRKEEGRLPFDANGDAGRELLTERGRGGGRRF